jgi:hypothetical protein
MAAGACWFGSAWLSGWMHDAPALITLPLGMVLYGGLAWLFMSQEPAPTAQPKTGEPKSRAAQRENTKQKRAGMLGSGGLRWAAAVLGLGLLAHVGLSWHLGDYAREPYAPLKAPLPAFPVQLDPATGELWQGTDFPGVETFRTRLPYSADSFVWRVYQTPGRPPISLYLVYSPLGEDRNHHPEVCLREVAGVPEDRAGRAVVFLDAQRPVQRFRFKTSPIQTITVYYWHYTLPPSDGAEPSGLQKLHRHSRPAPSVTAQVSLNGDEDEVKRIEGTFLRHIDALLRQEHLPAGVVQGCERKPVLVLGK